MRADVTKKLYARTVEAYHCSPKDGELDAWLDVLGNYQEAQLDAALRRWAKETELEEYTGRPRGSRMPSPAEIRLSMDRFERTISEHFLPCKKCDFGWVRVFTGRTVGAFDADGHGPNPVDPKFGAVRRCECFIEWASHRKSAA